MTRTIGSLFCIRWYILCNNIDKGSFYKYSFGGDTSSDANSTDKGGGVVRTNWRYSLQTSCREQLRDSERAIGYCATALQLLSEDLIYIFGGSDRNRNAINDFWIYSLSQDQFIEIVNRDENKPSP